MTQNNKNSIRELIQAKIQGNNGGMKSLEKYQAQEPSPEQTVNTINRTPTLIGRLKNPGKAKGQDVTLKVKTSSFSRIPRLISHL